MSEYPSQGMATCPICGHLNSSGSTFCAICGQVLPAAQAPAWTPPTPQTPPAWRPAVPGSWAPPVPGSWAPPAVTPPEARPQITPPQLTPPMSVPDYSQFQGYGGAPGYGAQGYGPAPMYPGYGYAPIPARRSSAPIVFAMAAIGLILVLIAGGLAFVALGGSQGTPAPSAVASGARPSSKPSASGGPANPTPRPAAGWTTTDSLTTGRWGHSTTLLQDGRVLVVGGFSGPDSGVVAVAEIYDPSTGQFARTGALNYPRGLHTATLLADGRVLIAGGDSDTTPPLKAEIYDPSTGQFTTTGSISTARWGHEAAPLPDGRVLVVGGNTSVGSSGYSTVATAEIYDPASGTFSPTDSMSYARAWYTATVLKDGRVLVAGGQHGSSDSPIFERIAEIYDPASGEFTATGSLASGRSGHAAALLADGRVLVVGGKNDESFFRSAEVYDPTSGEFTTTGSMITARDFPTATLLPEGQILVAGGRQWLSDAYENFASTEIYDPATGRFTAGDSMALPRARHAAVTLQDGRVLIVGGRAEGASIEECELYQP